MTGNEQSEHRTGEGSRRQRGAYRNFLRPRRPSKVFAADRDPSGSSGPADGRDAPVRAFDGEPA